MLSRYQQLSFTEAVETVVREKASEILTSEQVAQSLYGTLEGKLADSELTEVTS